jgi:MoaA/NifB/PqqE/SkfB family radical SAM enzyme
MLLVELGPQCNNSCIFCAQADARRDKRPFDITKLYSFLETLDIKEQSIAIVGGEPTIHNELPELIRLIRTLGATDVTLQTNARRLAYRNYADSLVGCKIDTLEISLHGSTAPMHDYHTRSEGSFRQTLRGIMNATDAKVPVVLSTTMTRSNYRHLPEMIRIASQAHVQRHIFRIVRALGSALEYRERVSPAMELVIPYLREAKRRANSAGIQLRLDGLRREISQQPPRYVQFFPDLTTEESEHKTERMPLPSARPKPASTELRSHDRRTGPALRELFPELFDEPPIED